MELIGIDVGFSAKRPSSGLARLSEKGHLKLAHTIPVWEEQRLLIGPGRVDVAAQNLRPLAPEWAVAAAFPRVQECNVVEAFPNAFLGVCVHADAYEQRPKIGRGEKFDWLYDCRVRDGLFRQVIREIGLDQLADLAHVCDEKVRRGAS